jgi:hypothetical protein
VIIVAIDYNGTGTDKLFGALIWGYDNMNTPINDSQIIYNPVISQTAIDIIHHDYPDYNFTY